MTVRDHLERYQIAIYFMAMALAFLCAWKTGFGGGATALIAPSLALMLFVTFLQVPFVELGQVLRQRRFLLVLLLVNFVLVPLLVAVMAMWLPVDPFIQLGVLMVLLTPCIDYVVTFAHLGWADSRLLVAATPLLLLMQIALLPVYLHVLLGEQAAVVMQPGPLLSAFFSLIVLPLVLAWWVQVAAKRSVAVQRIEQHLGTLPVPATALVLAVVVFAVMPQIQAASSAALQALPFYVAFSCIVPVLAWGMARWCQLPVAASKTVAFSAATRNSLVILPLAFAVPNAVPVLPAVIVTQTVVELVAQLVYIGVFRRR